MIALTIGYAVCPIDLILDFIPVLGQLDDLIIVLAGIALVQEMIPRNVMVDCRKKATEESIRTRMKWIAALIIILVWLSTSYLICASSGRISSKRVSQNKLQPASFQREGAWSVGIGLQLRLNSSPLWFNGSSHIII
jgi:uncharacterized membrane protein YkvA (DUF1232 family)